jgi:hypothetical protein
LASRQTGRAVAPRPPRDNLQYVTLRHYLESLRAADQRFAEERDRRYAEVARERETALTEKNRADLRALGLARDIQDLRDEQANRLREQIASERGLYITKADHEALIERLDAGIKPLADFVAAQQGRLLGEEGNRATASDISGRLIAALSLLVSVAVAVFLIVHGK